MKAATTPAATTWESKLSLDDRASISLTIRCTYDIEKLCGAMLETVREGSSIEEAATAAMIRMNAARIMKLNSVLMSLLDEDGTTLEGAYETLYGVRPQDGSTP